MEERSSGALYGPNVFHDGLLVYMPVRWVLTCIEFYSGLSISMDRADADDSHVVL